MPKGTYMYEEVSFRAWVCVDTVWTLRVHSLQANATEQWR